MKAIKLFCVPYAGGSASSFLSWNKKLNYAEVIPIQLAGRGERIADPFYKKLEDMAEDGFRIIQREVESNGIERYALFGHSMGSWITYEICKRIYNDNMIKPVHIFFSGNEAPYYEIYAKQTYNIKISHLSDEKFINEVLKWGAGTRDILENKKYGAVFVEILRRDYALIENYLCDREVFKINCNISVLNGLKDHNTKTGLEAWRQCANKAFQIYNFSGAHFFIEENENDVLTTIDQILYEEE